MVVNCCWSSLADMLGTGARPQKDLPCLDGRIPAFCCLAGRDSGDAGVQVRPTRNPGKYKAAAHPLALRTGAGCTSQAASGYAQQLAVHRMRCEILYVHGS